MQQTSGRAMTILTKPLDSGTGPGAEASTGVRNCVSGENAAEPCANATITIHVTHGKVIVTAQLDMAGHRSAQRVFERRRGSASGWVLTNHGRSFSAEAEWISDELAALADRLPFPFAVANMLPGKKASAGAVAQAAREVSHG